jgi:aryl-alcohol dehydrogenase-like predicted oxidoreductase
MKLVDRLKTIADAKQITISQLALARVMHQGADIVPIPGTRKIKCLLDNLESVTVQLDEKEIKQVEPIFYPGMVTGERYTAEGMKGVNA